MSRIEGPGPGNIPPELKATYKNEFSRSVDLFEKSLKEYHDTEAGNKKNKFKDVMDKALHIMNETVRGGLSEEIKKRKVELEKDYNKLIAEESPENFDKLQKDIQNIRKSL